MHGFQNGFDGFRFVQSLAVGDVSRKHTKFIFWSNAVGGTSCRTLPPKRLWIIIDLGRYTT